MALESRRKDILTRLKMENRALRAQSALLRQFVKIARSSSELEMLELTLQKALDLSAELTSAEKGSLFMLDENGAITASILTRGDASKSEKDKLIGKVMDKGLAGWVSRRHEIGLIEDTERDDRWLQLPDQPYSVRSALAVPVIRNEQLLGLLTLMHPEPGHFDNKAVAQMRITTDQIAVILDNARLLARLEESYRLLGEAKKEIEGYSAALDRELEKGHQIQKDFLPKDVLQPEGWEIAAHLHPAIQVSGDFYDVFPLAGDRIGLVIADVCDKGVGSALFMALFRSLIRIYAHREMDRQNSHSPGAVSASEFDPTGVMARTSSYVRANHGQLSMFATIFFGVLDTRNGSLIYVNAGHEPPLVTSMGGIKATLKSSGPAAGLFRDFEYQARQVQMDPGDILVGYTDGVTEAHSPSAELFSKRRLRQLIQQPPSAAHLMLDRITSGLKVHIGKAPQSDDITLLIVRRK